MLNVDVKIDAIMALKDAQAKCDVEAIRLGEASTKLFNLRKYSSEQVIGQAEEYVKSLTNSPNEFDKAFDKYRGEFSVFNNIVAAIAKKASKTNVLACACATAGVAAGAGVATLGPTAAMAIATTFGTTSTGIAISTLSGAAASKAALAWLGGGTLAAGGGGVAAGQALLSLASPLGWVIGCTSFISAGLLVRSHNLTIAEEAEAETEMFQLRISALIAAKKEVNRLISLTARHVDGVTVLLAQLKERAPRNYSELSTVQKEWLASLISHIPTLSNLLTKKVQC